MQKLSDLMWGPWTVGSILAAGIWFSCTNGWMQIARLPMWWRCTVGSMLHRRRSDHDGGSITQFQSAMTALAGTLGTGNIIGVATAISVGGAGSIFWMWIAALLGMMTAYAENVLGIKYRRRDRSGQWLGGPMMYMAHGLGARRIAALWALVCAVSAFGVGNLTQINSIAVSAGAAWGVPNILSGVVIAAAAAPAILGGIRSVARLTERFVPAMAIAYLVGCAAVLILNFRRIPGAFAQIFGGIFTPAAAGGGALGAMLTGVRRGVFTNEAGLGSSVLVHSSSDADHPAIQGMWGIFEIFADTIVMCTVTALVILTSGVSVSDRVSGAIICADAFRCVFGGFSDSFIAVILLLFAFATLVGWSCCGERAFGYLCGERYTALYRAAYVAAIIPGSIMRVNTAWALSDILNALMAVINTGAILLLWREVSDQTRDYTGRIKIPRK